MIRIILLWLILVCAPVVVAVTPTPSPTATATPTPSPTATATPAPSPTPFIVYNAPVTVEWDANIDLVIGYRLYYGVDSNIAALIGGISSPAHVIVLGQHNTLVTAPNLVDNTVYYFAATAFIYLENGQVGDILESEPSVVIAAIILRRPQPSETPPIDP